MLAELLELVVPVPEATATEAASMWALLEVNWPTKMVHVLDNSMDLSTPSTVHGLEAGRGLGVTGCCHALVKSRHTVHGLEAGRGLGVTGCCHALIKSRHSLMQYTYRTRTADHSFVDRGFQHQ